MAEILELTQQDFDKTISTGVVLVDFFATWCGPCRMMAPIISQVAQKLEGKAKVYKLDVDKAPEIASRFGVMSIPTLIFFKDGKEASRLIGVQQEGKIIEEIEKLF